MKREPITDSRYQEQQETLDEIASKLGVVAYRPDSHRSVGDKNAVLFYLKEDAVHNRQVDRQPTHYTRSEAADMKKYKGVEISPEYIYRDHFWRFENSNRNGQGDLSYANYGKIDLSDTDWKNALEGHILLALTRKLQARYIAKIGGYLGVQEADDTYNHLNQEIIKAFKMAYGVGFLGSVNYYDEERKKIVAGEKSVYEEYTGQKVFNFQCSFIVPTQDEELERLIREWNAGRRCQTGPNVDEILSRVDEIGGIHIIWY